MKLNSQPVKGFNAADVVRKTTAEIPAGGNEVQPGLIAYPFVYSSNRSKRFERLNEIATGFASFNLATIHPE